MVATPDFAPNTQQRAAKGGIWTALVVVAFALLLATFAVRRLENPRYPLDVGAALEGVRVTAAVTVPAAERVWTVVAVAVLVLGYWLRRRFPDFSPGEAAAGAVVLIWTGAYTALLTLGPIGLYRRDVLRALLAVTLVAAAATARRRAPAMPRRTRPRPRAGMWITAGAISLMVGPLLLLQLASPVSPFMDILPYVASVQKIVTFQFYDPFGNDAAGIWSPSRQVAGSDALFSFVGLVSGVSGSLAITTLIVPLCILQLVALYLLGRAVAGGLAGGMATLFMLETFIWRRTPDGRGTAVAFMLIAIGLVFMLARRPSGLRTVLGALGLAVSVAVNPLIGACGMQIAAAAVVLAWLDLGLPLIAPVVALAGATLVALPQVFIGTSTRISPYLLPLALAAGIALIAAGARMTTRALAVRPRGGRTRAWPVARVVTIVALLIGVLFLHARRQSSLFVDDWFGYGFLFMLGAGGLVALAYDTWRHPERFPGSAIPALAVWIGILDYTLADPRRFSGPLEVRSLAAEVTSKMMYYWTPYWGALGAGVFFGMLARRWGRLPAIAFALILVVYPLRHVVEINDFQGDQLSVAETWAFNLGNAAHGYFAGYPDRRWVLDENWNQVADVLRAEVDAGRLRYDTHVLTISPAIATIEAALGAGVTMDLVTPQFDPNSIWNVGGRVRGVDALPAALAARPAYVLLRDERPEDYPELAAAYESIFESPRTRLFRLHAGGDVASSDATPAASPAPSGLP